VRDKRTRDQESDPAVERLIDQAEEQGFGRKCSDPVTMARIAAALTGSEMRPAKRSRRTKVAA
jgi:hypothetical protein